MDVGIDVGSKSRPKMSPREPLSVKEKTVSPNTGLRLQHDGTEAKYFEVQIFQSRYIPYTKHFILGLPASNILSIFLNEVIIDLPFHWEK